MASALQSQAPDQEVPEVQAALLDVSPRSLCEYMRLASCGNTQDIYGDYRALCPRKRLLTLSFMVLEDGRRADGTATT